MTSAHKKHWFSLHKKAIAAIFLIYTILTSYFLYLIIVSQHHFAEKEILNAALMKGRLIADAIPEYALNKDNTLLQEFLKKVLSDRDIEYIQVVDSEKRLLWESGKLSGYTNNTLDQVRDEDQGALPYVHEIGRAGGLLHKYGHHFYVHMPVAFEGDTAGSLYLVVNTLAINKRLAKTTYKSVSIAVIIILAGIILLGLLYRQFQDSIKRLIRITKQVAEGDLSQYVSISTGDSLEELGESFNMMARSLAEREKELITARNTLVSMFNGITEGIAYISKEHKIIYANHAYKALLSKTGKVTDDGNKCYEHLWQRQGICPDCPGEIAIKTGRTEKTERKCTIENGEEHVFLINAYPVFSDNKEPLGFVEYIIDITHQKRMENELKRYTKNLEEIVQERTRRLKEAHIQIVHKEKMAALGQMATGVAHEIGNPLSSLSSIVRSVSIDSLGDGNLEEKLSLMQTQIDRIARIVREMMDFSRPASFRKALTHINEIIRSALAITRYDKKLKGIHVITGLDNEIPALKLDGDQLLQVFLNIIFNAADAMDGNGTLTVTSKLEDNSVLVLFEDTGAGIPEQSLLHIFDPFFTTKDAGRGTGLGLSVSYGIMQNMGGMIRAHNGKKGGAVFIVEIPITFTGSKI